MIIFADGVNCQAFGVQSGLKEIFRVLSDRAEGIFVVALLDEGHIFLSGSHLKKVDEAAGRKRLGRKAEGTNLWQERSERGVCFRNRKGPLNG